MVIWIATEINRMKKVSKGLIASLFESIGFPWNKADKCGSVIARFFIRC